MRLVVIAAAVFLLGGSAQANDMTLAQAKASCAGLAQWQSGYDPKDLPKDRAIARQAERIVIEQLCPLLFPVLAK